MSYDVSSCVDSILAQRPKSWVNLFLLKFPRNLPSFLTNWANLWASVSQRWALSPFCVACACSPAAVSSGYSGLIGPGGTLTLAQCQLGFKVLKNPFDYEDTFIKFLAYSLTFKCVLGKNPLITLIKLWKETNMEQIVNSNCRRSESIAAPLLVSVVCCNQTINTYTNNNLHTDTLI